MAAKNSSLVAFTVIFAITTIVAGWAAIYNAREASQAREALAMVRHLEMEPPPPPPPGTVAHVTPVSPCDAGVAGGVPGGMPGGQMGGVVGGVIGESQPPSATPKRIRVSGGVAQGNLISQPPPTYPQIAKAAKVQGVVVLQVVVDKGGKVEDVRVLGGHPMLAQSAMDAVRQWRYKPYLLNGDPVEVETTVMVTFKLAQ